MRFDLHFLSRPLRGPGVLLLSLGLGSGCRMTDDAALPMPPSPPPERIRSSLFPEEETPRVAAADREDLQLRLRGKSVQLAELAPVPAGEEAVIQVRAHSSTPYAEVEAVLEQLHALGYFIEFQAGE